ncbi:MAG: HD domain-containing protein [Bacillota bacterium]|uniref:HD domain-containing protein n=1 Tax=Thermanaerosceptrum fracticalcis TaxID=1712410 RepID=UPI0009DD7551|nr:HD domain-containing protein [Thermanaerosceptrum fracticalcis]
MAKWKRLKRKSSSGGSNFDEYKEYVWDLLSNETVWQMNRFRHHYIVSRLEHSLNVSYYSYIICAALGLDCKAAARGGLLHDFFLYDWRVENLPEGKHAFVHPRIALKNAEVLVPLKEKERDIILKHMWPLTWQLPRYPESCIVCLVDKGCALLEILCSWIVLFSGGWRSAGQARPVTGGRILKSLLLAEESKI